MLVDVVRAGGDTSLFEGHLDGDETVLLAQVACGRDPDGNAIAMLAALRDSAFVKNLEERVVIQLAHSDYRKRFRPRDLVSLNLEIKNVEELVINMNDIIDNRIERNLRADERVTVPGKRWLMAIGSTVAD